MRKSVLVASYSPLLAWREYGVAVSLQQEILFAFFSFVHVFYFFQSLQDQDGRLVFLCFSP
jgi:hypothetical protein